MPPVFCNGPIQNGDFTFGTRPGKAVGLRAATILNRILGTPGMPHLWNTVTLHADLRHLHAGHEYSTRRGHDLALVAEKYSGIDLPFPSIVTDADKDVADFALNVIERFLHGGTLRIARTTVWACFSCGHMAGAFPTICRACGGQHPHQLAAPHLVTGDLSIRPGHLSERMFSHRRKSPRHLDEISRTAARPLILSRTRAHGISLDRVGLPGLVLDPRAGVHVTALHAAQHYGRGPVVMTATPEAIAHVAAYGAVFCEVDGMRLLYGMHGRIPYDALGDLSPTYLFHDADGEEVREFESWFLPLLAMRNQRRTPPEQLPGLLKFFLKVVRRQRAVPSDSLRRRLQKAIMVGDFTWVTDRDLLATAHALSREPMPHG
jgi:hypothetical protein